jgi:hypothetical protein
MKNFLRLPTPKELGQKSNALPSRKITPETKEFSWEDYDALLKEKYPIRFFLFKTLKGFIEEKFVDPIRYPLKRFYEWVKYNFHPKHKYHMLDLRQWSEQDSYHYGWRDVDNRMLYAMMNLLAEYFKEKPYDLTLYYTLEQINSDPIMKLQYENLQEAKTIMSWWKVNRQVKLKEIDNCLNEWYKWRDNKDFAKILMDKLRKAEEELEIVTEETLIRLVRIRKSLWT